MDKFTINGVTFTDFGANNYSNGMHLVSAHHMPDNMVKEVLARKYPGIYLNPSQPCLDTFFGVFGTPEQYKEFYSRQRGAQISFQLVARINFNFDDPHYNEIKSEIEANYKDWWE